jgi:hypothetical protein
MEAVCSVSKTYHVAIYVLHLHSWHDAAILDEICHSGHKNCLKFWNLGISNLAYILFAY